MEGSRGSWTESLDGEDAPWRWRPWILETMQAPETPLKAPNCVEFSGVIGSVIKLVFHFQFKYINGLKAVKILVDARKRRV